MDHLRKQKRDRRITHQRNRKQIDNRGWRFIFSSREVELQNLQEVTCSACPHLPPAADNDVDNPCPSHQGLDHNVGEIRDSKSRSRPRPRWGAPRLRRMISTFSVFICQ
jgi:hypothetical protein